MHVSRGLRRALLTTLGGVGLIAAMAVPPAVSGRAAAASVTVLPNGVTVSSEVHHDTSAPLRSMADTHTAAVVHPAHRSARPVSSALAASPDTSSLVASPQIPATTVNFNGIGANGSAPPDNDGAIGATQYVELVNSQFEVFNKSGGVVLAAQATNTIWSGFGGGCQTNNDGDGTVLWDPMAQRWFIQQFSVTTTPYLDCLAISTSSDATGSWNRYSFQYASFPDYPKTGVWPDAYYASFNLFNAAGTQGLGTEVCAYNRSAMLTGAAATQQCFMATASGEDTLLPSTMDGTTQPPAGEPEWFVGLAFSTANALGYYKFHVDWATPANSSLSAEATIPVNPFTQACASACVPQSGVSQQLDALGDRVMFRLAYRNFGDHEAMVVNHSIISTSPSIGVRWYELRPSGTSLTLFQQGTIAPDSSYRWMGSIAMDQSNNMAVGYSVSSSSLHPGIRYTGRLAGDPAGTMPQGEATIITGAGSQGGGLQALSRWGDYTEMTVDPVDNCTFWYVNEYEASTGTFNWSTRIAAFRFPSCGGTITNDFSISASPSSINVTQGGSGTSTISTAITSGSAQTVTLSASGLPAGASASFNPASVSSGGSSTMTITTSTTTPAATSTVTVTGTGASATHTTTVSLTVTAPVTNDFSISANPSSVIVTQGGSGTSTIVTATTAGAAQTVSLSASGLPAGSSASFNPASVASGGSSTMTITTTASTPTGTSTVTVTGTGASATHSTTLTLTVNPSGSGGNVVVNGGFETGTFSGWTTGGASATVLAAAARSGSFGARLGTTTPTNGDSTMRQTVTVPTGGTLTFWYKMTCPDTLTYDWALMQVLNAGNTVLTTPLAKTCATNSAFVQVTANLSAYAGTSVQLLFTSHDDNYGADPSYTYFDDVSLTGAAPANDFSVSASALSPSSVNQGASATSTVSTATTSGSAQSVSLSASGLPAGATASFTPASVTSGGSSTLTVGTSATTPAGTYTVTITGTGASATHTTAVSLTVVANNFSISASPSSVTVNPGAGGTSTISTTLLGGAAQTINLSASGAPAGATATLNPTSVTTGGSSTLTISTASSTPAGTYTITVTGTAPSATHSTTVSLTVNGTGGGGVTNGGFETGTLAGWTSAGSASVTTADKQAGTYSARVGATTPTNGDSSISQTFTVPSGATGIQFYYNNFCPDTLTYDWATATLKDNTANTTTTPLAKTCANPSSGWTAVNAAATAGHSYTLTLISHDDNYSADPTYTDFDSVSTTSPAPPPPGLTQVSSDPFTDANAEHATQVEPDTLSNGSTIVSAFQVGRFNNGGADDIGWATSTNGGSTWSHGVLPGLTTVGGGSPNLGWARVSDPSVAYDARHAVWIISGLTIDSAANGRGVSVSRSTDGVTWQTATNAISQTADFFDKDWIVCDSTSTSPNYGNCYIEYDDNSLANTVQMLTSTDGGVTWSAARGTADTAHGLGGQPLVQPNGTVVVPYLDDGASQIRSFTSTNGGTGWNASVLIASKTEHVAAGGFRTSALPTAEIDSAGTVYVAWQDCRFRSGCPANDIVMSTSSNGTTWSAVVRIPIDATNSGVDHFVPGLGVDRSTSGSGAHLGLYYYYYPSASCSPCSLDVGFVSSANGGSTWSSPTQVAGPFALTTIAPTTQGPMVGDYISTSFVGGKAFSVFAVGVPASGTLNEGMYTLAGGLTAPGGHNPAEGGGGNPGPRPGPGPGRAPSQGSMTAY